MLPRRAPPLWIYIVGLNLTLLVPALAVTAVLLHRWVVAEQARLENATAARNAQALEKVDRFLASQIAMLQALATSPALEAGDLARFNRQATALYALQGTNIILRDRTGQEFVNTHVPFGTALPSILRDVDAAIVATGAPAVSDFLIGAVSREPVVRVSVPVTREQGVAYILSASIPAGQIGALIREAGVAPPYSGSVSDRRGIIIGRSAATESAAGKPLPGFGEIAGERGSWSGRNIVGELVFGTYQRSALSGWTFTVGIERQALQAPLTASLRVLVPVMVGLGLLAAAMSVLVGRRILRANDVLLAGARALARGEVIAPASTRVGEADQIGVALASASLQLRMQADALQAINRDLERRVAVRTRELAGKEALLTMTLDAMDQGLVMVDGAGIVAVTNRRAADLLGLDPAFLASRPSCEAMREALQARGEFAALDPAIRDGLRDRDLDRIGARYERVRPNGQVLEVANTATADGGILRIYTDVTARKAVETALAEAHRLAQQARRAAEAASAAKTDFLATMSHEIRTPLTAVLGYADLLTARSDLETEQARLVGRIVTAGEALRTIVDDVLDFSRIEAGRVDLAPWPFSLADLIEEALALVRPEADRKGLPIAVAIEPGLPPRLVGDVDRLRQILLNLLNNAVKFTPAGSIGLAVARDPTGPAEGGGLLISVRDTGIGIPADKHARLFERFSQVDGSIQRQYGGTGLGLAISRRLVEAMHGRIGVESREGEGSTFWFRLALPAAEPDADPRGGGPAERPRVGPGRILLADDVAINQEIVRRVLEARGHVVEAVDDGAAAIRAVQEGRYDLVLMDVQMPGTDGLTATRRIRQLPGDRGRVPILALTANVLPAQVAAFRAAGMDDHIGKPFRRDDFVATVERWLSGPLRAPRRAAG
ncbi:ATP-binding protein [Methylobacterium sp. WSM2598]|uniref:ATP-binding protein n=1 Tax=Methylobacterium sp. WSM2598 TaxID=398261 RepID=UPI0003689022|nr:ATP-binding protein [Methylobacterium sp. WSM2598]